ncbi:oligosaccharide repeat unit polymerase [Aerococcus sp. JJEM-2022b]|uniref:DUF6418 domain-containing protein n=1 Tax=Aerococcus mictus TaxID=2976810 RepID=UPI00227ABD49|nr:DUF6418 domain-containing protein [Aerococcus mictus]MCY3079923.1 oligosaccharide repeat unit polymerase [Aerococcus mictus]
MKVRKSVLTTNLFFGFIFIICSIFSRIKFFSYIALLFFTVYFVFYLVLKNKEFALKYLAFLFISGTAVLGTSIIELIDGIFLVELRTYSSFVGSLPLLILGYWFFWFIIELFDFNLNSTINYNKIDELSKYKIFFAIMNLIILVMFLLLFSKVAAYPAFLLGVDRFIYASEFLQLGILEKVATNAPLLAVFPILTIIYNNNFHRILGIVSLSIYVLYFIWIGNKFGPFFTLICVFLLVYYKKIMNNGEIFLKRIFAVSITIFTLVLLYTIMFSTSISSYNGISYIEQRASQQGQLWWKTYDIVDSTHPEEFINEVKALNNGKESISDNIGSDYGIYKIMYLCAPKKLVDAKLTSGSRYSEAGFATMYYYFGKFGVLVFSCLIGCLIAITINAFLKYLALGDYIKALIFLRFFLLERTAITMFTFNDFFGIVSILSYMYLLIMINKKIKIYKKNGLTFSIVNYK